MLIGEARAEAGGLRAGAADPARAALLMLVNGDAEDRLFSLPAGSWRPLLDSTRADGAPVADRVAAASLLLPGQCVMLLCEAAVDADIVEPTDPRPLEPS